MSIVQNVVMGYRFHSQARKDLYEITSFASHPDDENEMVAIINLKSCPKELSVFKSLIKKANKEKNLEITIEEAADNRFVVGNLKTERGSYLFYDYKSRIILNEAYKFSQMVSEYTELAKSELEKRNQYKEPEEELSLGMR